MYLYPSHDIVPPAGQRQDWFCMEDYHVFSSENLTDWTDHGVIVTQNKVPWVRPDSYSMWAPDCVYRNGKYYFYFPSAPAAGRGGFAVGVAIADNPEGPFVPEPEPIKGINGIDPCVLQLPTQCLHLLGQRPLRQTEGEHEGAGRRHAEGDREVG